MTELNVSPIEDRIKKVELVLKELFAKHEELVTTVQLLDRFKRNFQFGTVDIPPVRDEFRADIIFPLPFAAAPIIVASAGNHQNDHLIVSVRAATPTGFQGWIRRSNSIGWGSHQHMYWIAVGEPMV